RHLRRGTLLRGIVVEVLAEPALDLRRAHAFATSVVGNLVAADLAERKIARLRMGEVKAADARSGPHGKRLGDQHAGVRLHIEQAPQGSLLRVIGASRVTRGRTNAAILFVNE